MANLRAMPRIVLPADELIGTVLCGSFRWVAAPQHLRLGKRRMSARTRKKNALKGSAAYPKAGESGLDPRVEDERQIYLPGHLPVPASTLEEAPGIAGRYHANVKAGKALGAVYTPPRVAAALVRWAVRSPEDTVLDPSCGEGVFLSAARTRLADLGTRTPRCVGVDIDPATAAISGAICSDFFQWIGTAPQFDVVVGNPPFIRSHLFSEESRRLAFAEMRCMGLRPSRLMSTWAPFLTLSSRALNGNGRLAMVIPEELLAVGYAEALREFLLRRFRRVIVCLPTEGIFPEVQQAVVLLLCDNDAGSASGLLTIRYADLEQGHFGALDTAEPWPWNCKWTHLFLSATDRSWLDGCWRQVEWQPLSHYGRVEVGVVTGDNDFFLLNREKAAPMEQGHLVPVIASARDLRGITFGAEDFRRVLRENRPAFLLRVADPLDKLPRTVRSYLETGEKNHVKDRYKCRTREPWYSVPSVWESDGLLLRQAGDMPRLVHLSKRCTATDTIHRVRWHAKAAGRRHAASFMNTWTMLAGELTGRSYGGGVLELMPSEANGLPMPEPTPALDQVFHAIDDRVRMRRYDDALSIVDQVVLPSWMSSADRQRGRAILTKLIARRKSRKRANSIRFGSGG